MSLWQGDSMQHFPDEGMEERMTSYEYMYKEMFEMGVSNAIIL